MIPAVTETIEAGTLRLEIRIDGQHPGARPGAWYETPRLHLLITGQDFVVPYGWEAFSNCWACSRCTPAIRKPWRTATRASA